MDTVKQQIIQLLTALDYANDKEKFATDFLNLCHQETISELLSKIPKDKLEQLNKHAANKNSESIVGEIKQYIPDDEYQRAFKAVVLRNIDEALNEVLPVLDQQQLDKFETSLNA